LFDATEKLVSGGVRPMVTYMNQNASGVQTPEFFPVKAENRAF
jgi:hypothetical protein